MASEAASQAPNPMPGIGAGGGAEATMVLKVYEQVLALYEEMAKFEDSMQATLEHLCRDHVKSARNLLHYIAFRRHDVRQLQRQLSEIGLSSLGRSESSILWTLQQVLSILERLAETPRRHGGKSQLTLDDGKAILSRNTEALFGPPPSGRHVRIMVTMSAEAVCSYDHVRSLLANGMECMRINCAHDDAAAWTQMILHLRRARQELNKPCSILMDLAGPKLRTGPMAPGPAVHKWRPKRDTLGRVTVPVKVVFSGDFVAEGLPPGVDLHLTGFSSWIRVVRVGDRITFKDARQARRELQVTAVAGDYFVAECRKTAYLVPGIKFHLLRKDDGERWRKLSKLQLCSLPPTEQTILVKPREILKLTTGEQPGQPAIRDEGGTVIVPAHIPCSLPEVFADLQVDQPIWFDDGKIGGRIVRVAPTEIEVMITHAHPEGNKLAADKGINLPDSRLRLPSLTASDIEDLPFVVQNADMVGYSFVRTPSDIAHLQEHLHNLGGEHLGLVLKIETRHAFDHLPQLLLAAMRSPRVGVMIARGDLAIECGFERLAELQEEILWFCEAAHVPVVWATQVLEHLTKEGIPSRAEITDAAMGERAECVMLNKGPHVVQAVQTLDGILKRMAEHQIKKRAMLRPLKLAGRFGE